VVYSGASALAVNSAGTSGQALLSGGTGAPTFGTLGLTYGGTNANITPSAGAVIYSGASGMAINTAGTSGQPLLSGGTGAPTFGTLGIAYGGTGAGTVAGAQANLQVDPAGTAVALAIALG